MKWSELKRDNCTEYRIKDEREIYTIDENGILWDTSENFHDDCYWEEDDLDIFEEVETKVLKD